MFWIEILLVTVLQIISILQYYTIISPVAVLIPLLSLVLDKLFDQAIELYTKAIELNPRVATYYGNRSIAHLKTESYGYALADATKALELDRTYIKVKPCYYIEIH